MDALTNRKNLIAVGVLASLVVPSSAIADKRDEICEGVSNVAHEVMMQRQEGVPLQDVMRNFNRGQENQNARDGLRRMLVRAYSQPRFLGEDFQKRAARDFADKYMVACLSSP